MSDYENFAIPQLEDGRDFISSQLVADDQPHFGANRKNHLTH